MPDTTAKKPEPEPEPPWAPSRVWAVPTILGIWIWCMGWLPQWAAHEGAGFPPILVALAGCVLGLVLMLRAGQIWGYGEHVEWVPLAGRILGLLIGVATAAWLWLAASTSVWAQTPLLLLGGGLLAVLWWTLDNVIAPRGQIKTVAQIPLPADEIEMMRRMLDKSGMGAVDVLEMKKTRAGQTWTFGPKLLDAEGQPLEALTDFLDFTQFLPRLTQQLAVHWRKRGIQFEDNDIRPEPLKVDRWYLHVNTTHVERQDVPLTDAPAPRPWRMPAWLGLFLDGDPIEISLAARHGKCVGASGAGKGVVANNIIRAAASAASSGRRESHVWIMSTNKLNPLVWPWLTGYFSGRDEYPIIDWVAGEDPAECLRMLHAAYRLGRSRNAELDDESKVTIGPERPGLLILWDEGNDGGRRPQTQTIEGVDYTISRLFSALLEGVRSSGISCWAFTQQGLYDGLGPSGDEMMRNFTIRICTATETYADGTFTMPKLDGMGVDSTKLRDHTVYIQPSMADDARPMPGKVAHLDGTVLIDQVVRQIAAMPPAQWSESDLEALGADYELRWHPERVPTLARACRKRGWEWRPAPPGGQPPPAQTTEGINMNKAPQQPPPQQPPPTGGGWEPSEPPEGAGSIGMPTNEDLTRLETLAQRMQTEADAMRTADTPAGAPVLEEAAPAVATAVKLPEPMPSVARAVDAIPADVEWVATALLCEQVWGSTARRHVEALGRAIAAHCEGLRATDPRSWSGGRGRGYQVVDLRAAMARLRRGG
jgi:hypothetical protein